MPNDKELYARIAMGLMRLAQAIKEGGTSQEQWKGAEPKEYKVKTYDIDPEGGKSFKMEEYVFNPEEEAAEMNMVEDEGEQESPDENKIQELIHELEEELNEEEEVPSPEVMQQELEEDEGPEEMGPCSGENCGGCNSSDCSEKESEESEMPVSSGENTPKEPAEEIESVEEMPEETVSAAEEAPPVDEDEAGTGDSMEDLVKKLEHIEKQEDKLEKKEKGIMEKMKDQQKMSYDGVECMDCLKKFDLRVASYQDCPECGSLLFPLF